MNYATEIKECIEKGLIKSEDVFEIAGTPLEGLLTQFYNFCRENLDRQSQQIKITPNYFIYTNSLIVNAVAVRKDSDFMIALNLGLLQYCNKNYKENEELKSYFEKAFPDTITKFDNPANLMAFQICTQFTFHHELAHLFQFSSHEKEAWIQERNDEELVQNFIAKDHILEINADTYASIAAASHISQYIQKMFGDGVTFENVIETFSFFCCCLLNYTLGFSNNTEALYFDKYTHPHSFVRLLNCILNIDNHIEKSDFFRSKNIDLRKSGLFKIVVIRYKELEQNGVFKTNLAEVIEAMKGQEQTLVNYLNDLQYFKVEDYTDAMEVWNKHFT